MSKRYGQRPTQEQRLRAEILRRRQRADYNAKRRALKLGRRAVDVSREDIIERDGQTCYLCGKDLSINEVTFDHVTPLSQGGDHTPENIRLAHRACNSKKGSRFIEAINFSTW